MSWDAEPTILSELYPSYALLQSCVALGRRRMSRKNLILKLGVQMGQNRAQIGPKLTFFYTHSKTFLFIFYFFAKS